jgi:nanoRNase/pAp phosphatase (c-di-AMP/oligoRNAs hydrolase)
MTQYPELELLSPIDPQRKLYVQTHRHPDFDALAAGFGLVRLLQELGHDATLIYTGQVLNHAMAVTIQELEIPISLAEPENMSTEDQIYLVDCFPGNGNVDQLPGQIIGVVDHHPIGEENQTIPYLDVRDSYGSCASMIAEYFLHLRIFPSNSVATILMMGIMMDTAYLSRGVCDGDLGAFEHLFHLGDWKRGNFLLKNSLSIQDLPLFRIALTHFRHYDSMGFSFLDVEVPGETLALMADDFLRFHEIHTVVLVGHGPSGLRVSVRNEDSRLSAGELVQEAIKGLGDGGGHSHMGGGVITTPDVPDEQALFGLFVKQFQSLKEGNHEQ